MTRINQPYWRKSHRCWYLNHNGKQVRLSPDKALSLALWHERMSQPEEAEQDNFKFSEIVYKFLDDLTQIRSKGTVNWYQQRIAIFLSDFGTKPAAAVKPFEVLSSVNKHKNWSANTRRNSLRAIKRTYKWAHINGLLKANPMATLEMPPQEARETVVTPEQMQQLEELLPEGPFKELLQLAWDTGMRPEELFRIEAEFVTKDQIVIPSKSSKGKCLRIVYVGTERSQKILEKYVAAYPKGPLMRNGLGNPWVKNAVNCQFHRLKKRHGISLHLGAFRKGFCTEALKAGLDTVTVAHLMGHKDAVMVSRIYGKVAQDRSWMAEAARRAKRSPG